MEALTYGRWENCVSVVFHTLTVSASLPTRSSKCMVIAWPSSSRLDLCDPEASTRSVMSKMMLVNPSLSIQTSWLSGTLRKLLENGQ